MAQETGKDNETDQEYEFRHFTAQIDKQGNVDPQTEAWLQSVNRGFYDKPYTDEGLKREAKFYQEDNRLMTGVYATKAPPHSVGTEVPVATFVSFQNTLSTGKTLLDAHLISEVTVRPTHRRRGLLRRMMTESLDSAVEQGLPIAALTATEATIYGRFGFGVATHSSTIELDTTSRFALPPIIDKVHGIVELARRDEVPKIAGEVFRQFHEMTRGSVGRQAAYPGRIDGTVHRDGDEPDISVRAALHYELDGTPDGYVTYKYLESKDNVPVIKVVDLVSTGKDSYLGLWNFIGNLDLIERIQYNDARIDDSLPWALGDTRGYRVTGREDLLWLRILDVAQCLQAREFSSDGELTLAVRDPMGYAAGTYDVSVSGGVCSVQQTADAPREDADILTDVASLGSAFLGGATVGALADAGKVLGNDEAITTMGRMFAVDRAPYCITHF